MTDSVVLGTQHAEDTRNAALRREARKDDDAFRWLMSDERGRRFIAKQLRESQALAPRVSDTPDPVMFREGQRAHGLALIQEIMRLAPQHLATVIALSVAAQAKPTGETDGDRDD